MSKFFNYYPKTFYTSNNNSTGIDTVTNIIARFAFEKSLKENSSAFYKYTIKDSDTPEIIAHKFYDHSERHWIVLLFNDIIDPQYDWPLQSDTLIDYINTKLPKGIPLLKAGGQGKLKEGKENNNLKNYIPELTKYMVNQGMNIKPLPNVKFITNDKANAENIFGKTAFYNPEEKSITLFTMNRHPKDVLRSFAHEMIHHEQNLDSRLNNIGTTNTNEDGDLPEIEREAYEKGNMMFRNWEDSIKNV